MPRKFSKEAKNYCKHAIFRLLIAGICNVHAFQYQVHQANNSFERKKKQIETKFSRAIQCLKQKKTGKYLLCTYLINKSVDKAKVKTWIQCNPFGGSHFNNEKDGIVNVAMVGYRTSLL